jgi:hypothetical protein
MTLNTLPELKSKNLSNSTESNLTNLNNLKLLNENNDNLILTIMEYICIAWFTFEYLIRFISSPNKWLFFKAPLNIVDLITIIPFYGSLVLISQPFLYEYTNLIQKIVQVFRLLRIVRIFKLARHSNGLRLLGRVILQAYKELGLMCVFIGFGILVFSSLAYFAEKDQFETQFTSIPATFW